MKIGWISYDWRTDTGGKGVSANAFMNFLAQNGHEVTLYDLEMSSRKEVDRSRLIDRVRIIHLWVGSMRGMLLRLPYLFKESFRHDLMLVGAAPNIDLVAMLALVPARWFGAGRLVRLEFTNPKTYLDHSVLHAAYDVLGRLLFPRADLTIAPAQGLVDQIVRHYDVPAAKTRFCPWPCVPDNFAARTAEQVPEPLFNAERPAVLAITVMRLSLQDKDYDTLLSAFRTIHDKTGAELAVLGAGDPAPIEALIAREKLEGKVHLMGERRNPYAYVAKADVFLFASKYEGSPLVIAEALACGTPVVATDCDFGPRELIEDGRNGFLVPVRDSARLAERAIELIEKPDLRRRFAEEGRKGANVFRVPEAAGAFMGLLEQTLRG